MRQPIFAQLGPGASFGKAFEELRADLLVERLSAPLSSGEAGPDLGIIIEDSYRNVLTAPKAIG